MDDSKIAAVVARLEYPFDAQDVAYSGFDASAYERPIIERLELERRIGEYLLRDWIRAPCLKSASVRLHARLNAYDADLVDVSEVIALIETAGSPATAGEAVSKLSPESADRLLYLMLDRASQRLSWALGDVPTVAQLVDEAAPEIDPFGAMTQVQRLRLGAAAAGYLHRWYGSGSVLECGVTEEELLGEPPTDSGASDER